MALPFEVAVFEGTPARSAQVTAAIILAAGASTRMGTPKAMLPYRGRTFLSHLTARLSSHCDPVIAVLGANADAVERSRPPARLVVNKDWANGQLSSLQCGLRALPAAFPSALFTLVDHPDPADETVARLLRSQSLIAIPVYNGKRGHPVFFRAPLIPELLALPPTESAKQIFRRHSAETEYIPVDDPAVTDDIDDPEALARFHYRTKQV